MLCIHSIINVNSSRRYEMLIKYCMYLVHSNKSSLLIGTLLLFLSLYPHVLSFSLCNFLFPHLATQLSFLPTSALMYVKFVFQTVKCPRHFIVKKGGQRPLNHFPFMFSFYHLHITSEYLSLITLYILVIYTVRRCDAGKHTYKL